MGNGRRALIVYLALSLGCGSPGTSANPDVVIGPQELMEELIDDHGGTIDKYDGKLLELSGVVDAKTAPHGLNDTLGVAFRETSAKTKFDANLSYFFFDPQDPEAKDEFGALTAGQRATLLCRFSTLDPQSNMVQLKQCRTRP